MERILKYLKIIAEAWKGILAVAGIITFVATMAVKDAEKNRKLNTLVDTQKIIVDSISSFSRQLQPYKEELSKFNDNLRESKAAYNGLRQVVLDHTSKAQGMTIDQFKQYMETAPELKKNEYLFWIPQKDSNQLNQNITLK